MNESPDVRVSDEERDRVVDLMSEHASAGRLTLAELEERVEHALTARTRADLDALTRDLPSAPAPVSRRKPTRWLVSLMGGSDRKGRWRVGRTLNVITVMGGCDLDLRRVEMDEAGLEITVVTVMGGCDIYLPDTVDVEVSDLAIMGGNDQRGSQRLPRPGAPLVRIRIFSLMGGTDVWRLPIEASGLSLREAKRKAKELER